MVFMLEGRMLLEARPQNRRKRDQGGVKPNMLSKRGYSSVQGANWPSNFLCSGVFHLNDVRVAVTHAEATLLLLWRLRKLSNGWKALFLKPLKPPKTKWGSVWALLRASGSGVQLPALYRIFPETPNKNPEKKGRFLTSQSIAPTTHPRRRWRRSLKSSRS